MPIDKAALTAALTELDKVYKSSPNAVRINPLEAQASLKWQELRLLRAGPINLEVAPRVQRGHYE